MKEKNVSNLKKTLAVVSLLAPVTAQPLGIGDIELHSVLNQKLDAVIRLHLAGENPSDISVRLASPEKFDQAGVPWSYSLSKLKFDPVLKPDGSMIIKVSSKDAFVEPFLNFLLEVSWPQGNLVREFTMLIDPPADYGSPVLPLADNRDFSSDAEFDRYIERPVKKRKARRASAPITASDLAGNITPQTPTSGEVGPIKAQDTLWRIASGLAAQQGVSTTQMMTALFKANPDAFINGNIDLLKAGVILKVPEMQGISQYKGVKNQSRVGASAKILELVAPNESSIPENAEPTGTGNAHANSPSAGGVSNQGSGKDLELQARIEKLQEQLNMMQQLLALKDQQLNALQNKDKTPAANTQATVLPSTVPTIVSTSRPQTVASPLPEIAQTSPSAQAPAVSIVPTLKPTPVASATKKPQAPVVKPVVPPEDDLTVYYLSVGGVAAGLIALFGGLWWRKRRIDDRTNSESMFASASQIKMPDTDSALSVPVVDISNPGAYDVGTVGESSFISDFTPSDFDAFDTEQNDVDPLSEADVYLAYGRYQQAEDLIRHAIKDIPERDDFKLKLLEILYANENKDGFATYAQELAGAGKQDDKVFWTKVTDMGREILPEHVLFGGTEITAITNADSIAASNSGLDEDTISSTAFSSSADDLDFGDETLPDLDLMDEIKSELAELNLDSDHERLTTGRTLDFDISGFADSSAPTEQEPKQSANAIETIEFDTSGLSVDNSTASTIAEESIDEALKSFDFSFDSDLSESDSASPGSVANNQLSLDMSKLESFEFPDYSAATEPVAANKVAESSLDQANVEAPAVGEEFDFNFDFEVPAEDTKAATEEADDMGVFDLTDMDEFETKIDLAKAYIDMGDTEMAKKIAEEVLEKGSDAQKQAAKSILNEL